MVWLANPMLVVAGWFNFVDAQIIHVGSGSNGEHAWFVSPWPLCFFCLGAYHRWMEYTLAHVLRTMHLILV